MGIPTNEWNANWPLMRAAVVSHGDAVIGIWIRIQLTSIRIQLGLFELNENQDSNNIRIRKQEDYNSLYIIFEKD